MRICCDQTVVKSQDFYLYKGYSNHQQKRIPIRESQVNPIISNTQQPFRLFVKSKLENQIYHCQSINQPFIDKDFPPTSASLGNYSGRKVEWVRLCKLFQSIVSNQYNPTQILSMKEGDSYFLASLAALSDIPALIQQVFDQQLKISQVGAYKLNISINGKPQQIIIDDYLPVFADNHQRAAFSHIDPNLIWVPLFQKVYAKIKGSYQKIDSGFAHDVLATFSLSPCVYYIIPTDFRHQQQDKCWNTLIEAAQMRFPCVFGSRKKYACSFVTPNQTYCFKGCKVIMKQKIEQRRILIWNLPGKRVENEQFGITYEKNGDVISFPVVQFMRNFQVIDIANVRKNFSSHFYEFKCDPTTPVLYAFTTYQKTVLYLTLQRTQGQIGRLRILLINCTNEATYQFMTGRKQQGYSDVSIRIERLPIGSYMVICESGSKSQCLLHVYSPTVIPLVKFVGSKNILLQRTFMQLAQSSPSEQVAISKQHKDWYMSKILFDDLGLAFFMVNLEWNSIVKCEISFNRKQLLEEGIDIVNKTVKEGYCASVEKGYYDILIFDFIGKGNEAFCFPPDSLKIKMFI